MPSPKPIEVYLGSHPAALDFVQAPKPFPSSFARETYFGVTAYAFTNTSNQKKFGRYRILPEDGNDFLNDDQASKAGGNYLFDEIKGRIAKGPVRFKIVVQIAEPGDVTDDATVHWPETRQLASFGTVELTSAVADNDPEQQHIIFDPIPRVEGIDPSADPLLELRAAAYLLSGRQRRAAKAVVFSR